MKKILLNLMFLVLLIFVRGCAIVPLPYTGIDQYGNLVQDSYVTQNTIQKDYPVGYDGIAGGGPIGSPWLGPGSQWVLENGQWYHGNTPYGLYYFNDQYGWWPTGQIPENYRLFRVRRSLFPWGGYYNNGRIIYYNQGYYINR